MAEISTLTAPASAPVPDLRTPDDLARLLETFRVPGWPYTDFSEGGACGAALARWPLLRELARPRGEQAR